MTNFARLEAMASRSVDWLNGETFTLIPMKTTPNGRATGDTDRPTITGRGVFDTRKAAPALQMGDRKASGGSDFRIALVDAVPELSVSRFHFSNGDGSPNPNAMPRQGDRVRLDSRPGAPDYQIMSAMPDGHSRITLTLSRGAHAGA